MGKVSARTVHFDSVCPFLFCLKSEPHDHPVCPECGAVDYGSLFCNTCAGPEGKGAREKQMEEYLPELARWKAGRERS